RTLKFEATPGEAILLGIQRTMLAEYQHFAPFIVWQNVPPSGSLCSECVQLTPIVPYNSPLDPLQMLDSL
ncbi:MAG: hypothetical protein WAM69_18570, partial [Candidatus Sulfotelmatobacter sp.]